MTRKLLLFFLAFNVSALAADHRGRATTFTVRNPMFGQSNDLFYSLGEKGIALFDALGKPLQGDLTRDLVLWDAGTEQNQEPGAGPDQAPRQRTPNSGPAENEPIHPVADGFMYPRTTEALRVTIVARGGRD
ncbi:MAG: spondin domain-containing protein [Acidobacteria bacterium]|nr:spondin domain-containing protein [Acidobacteriota bacterium]